ncbi:hypothetical protein KIW84_022355 [Lathyrus oleraceus]|uniref:Uncharacterized protein n=1 Tax=Pisum sativum TaxID=3888 RepID=A0A9D4YE73_PEA|nr:hypothetical protein KIW84_022355 [Pisum sativum]
MPVGRETWCASNQQLASIDLVFWESACNMRQVGIVNMTGMLEKQLTSELSKTMLQEDFTLSRAFSHYLTIMDIDETHHRVCKGGDMISTSKSYDDVFNQLVQSGISPDDL